MFTTSEETAELYAALAKAQGGFDSIEKDRTAEVKGEAKGSGKEYRYTYAYATLSSILRAVRPALHANDLAILQAPKFNGQVLGLTTRVTHGSGQWLEEHLEVPANTNDIQKVGSAITYARRYALLSILNLAPDEDDDGAAARDQRPQGRPQQRQERPQEQRQERQERPQDERQSTGNPSGSRSPAEKRGAHRDDPEVRRFAAFFADRAKASAMPFEPAVVCRAMFGVEELFELTPSECRRFGEALSKRTNDQLVDSVRKTVEKRWAAAVDVAKELEALVALVKVWGAVKTWGPDKRERLALQVPRVPEGASAEDKKTAGRMLLERLSDVE